MVAKKKYLFSPKSGFLYVRVKGKYLGRITAKEGTPEFDQQYWAILTGKVAESKISWRTLILLFRHSDKWAAYSPRYREDLERVFQYLEDKIGNRSVRMMTQADIYDAMEKNNHRIRFANYIPTTISLLSKLAIRRRWRPDNPAIGIEPLVMPRKRRKPHIPWPDWAVEKWRAYANPLPRLIFEIGVGSVQHPGDWTNFRWSDYDGDALRIIQGKTGVFLELPCTIALKSALDSVEKSGLNILTHPDGQPMNYRYMSRVMRLERERLGLVAYDLHALRYRGVMELARAGCDDDEISAYSGHSSKAMIRKYAGAARQIMRARQAREKRQ